MDNLRLQVRHVYASILKIKNSHIHHESENWHDFEEIRKYFQPFPMIVYEKIDLKARKIKKTFVPKIILNNYISYKGDLTYIRIFPVYLRIYPIFTGFSNGKWVSTMCCTGNLLISDASLSQLGKIPV